MAEPMAELSGKTSTLPYGGSANKSNKKKSSGTSESRLDYAVSDFSFSYYDSLFKSQNTDNY